MVRGLKKLYEAQIKAEVCKKKSVKSTKFEDICVQQTLTHSFKSISKQLGIKEEF